MSDPVSNTEIEDVLSSIRRLVSEEPAIKRRVRDGATGKERLVLTPAHRVDEDVPPEIEDSDADGALGFSAEERPSDDQPTGSFYEMSLEERIAELEAAIGQTAGEWEPDGSEDGTSDETRPLEVERGDIFERGALFDNTTDQVTSAGSMAASSEGEPASQEDGFAEDATDAERSEGDEDLTVQFSTHRRARGEKPVDEQAESAGEDIAEAEQEAEAEHRDAEYESQDGPGPELAEAGADEPDEGSSDWAANADEPPTPEGIVAESSLEAEELEPQESDDPTEEDDRQEIVQDSELEASKVHGLGGDADWTEPLVSDEEDVAFGADAETVTIDEDALRELVADLVRDELQGVLGERITRNVRRLVRQEIQRALAIRELD